MQLYGVTEIRKLFVQTWNVEWTENRKLSFYNSIKATFGVEQYIKLNIKP